MDIIEKLTMDRRRRQMIARKAYQIFIKWLVEFEQSEKKTIKEQNTRRIYPIRIAE